MSVYRCLLDTFFLFFHPDWQEIIFDSLGTMQYVEGEIPWTPEAEGTCSRDEVRCGDGRQLRGTAEGWC